MNDNNPSNYLENPLSLIQTYLERYGWQYELIETDTVLTGFCSNDEAFTLFIRCYDDIAYFSIPDYADKPNDSCTEEGYKYLLDANYHMVLSKFSVDEAGKIVLTIELPIKLLSYDLFTYALFMLASNAVDQLHVVKDALNNPEFESPYKPLPE